MRRLILDVEKPAAGGRMLARHQGQVVLVRGAIPGERVEAAVERTAKGVLFADTIAVLQPSADRRDPAGDPRCGGNVFAHIAYPRQVQIKGEILSDAFTRIARVPLAAAPEVVPSPEHGYRMRARLHARSGRLGFLREGTHELCDAGATGQLLPATLSWLEGIEETLRRARLAGLLQLEIAENIAGDRRACHLELAAGTEPSRFARLADGLEGLSVTVADRRAASGSPGRQRSPTRCAPPTVTVRR